MTSTFTVVSSGEVVVKYDIREWQFPVLGEFRYDWVTNQGVESTATFGSAEDAIEDAEYELG